MKKKIKEMIHKRKTRGELVDDGPRITNETVAAHREQVLKSARKYVLPLQHSKHRIVIISTTLFIVLVLSFLTYCTLALYRFKTNSTFLYRVTQVVPFPLARFGSKFIAYENYLFELRHYEHYYETQVNVDFDDPRYKDQLIDYKRRALEKVISDAYVKQLAKENGVGVTDKEVDERVDLLRSQDRLGGGEEVFEDVLKDYWGWSLADFKRSLRQEMLGQKVIAKVDTETQGRANTALSELKAGGDFAAIARKYSEDPATKETGGDLGVALARTNREVSAQATDALFRLQPGQHSEIINIGSGLAIVKNIEQTGDKIRPAIIIFNFKESTQYINDAKEKSPSRVYIKL